MKLSASELADLKLNCLPTTRVGVVHRAQKENWLFEDIKGKGGRSGLKRVYELPDYVVKEMQAKDGSEATIKAVTKRDAVEYRYQKNVNDRFTPYNEWVKTVDLSEVVPIRYYRNVKASAGNGAFNSEEQPEPIYFRCSFIYRYLGKQPEHLICIRVKGDSMYPTIISGGTVLIDLQACNYDGEGIYLIRQVDELKIKRLQKMSPDKMLVISDNNTVYAPIEVDLSKTEDFCILGKYLWSAGVTK